MTINVIMLVANPIFKTTTVSATATTTQVAPTIIKALGLEPKELDAVREEGTAVLPRSCPSCLVGSGDFSLGQGINSQTLLAVSSSSSIYHWQSHPRAGKL